MSTIIKGPNDVEYVAVIDSSGWQLKYVKDGKIKLNAQSPDFTAAKQLGIAGIFHRIGNGTSFDESFPLVYKAAKAAGIPVGAYYYAQPARQTAIEAANIVMMWIQRGKYVLDLPIMLDWEEYYGDPLTPTDAAAWIREFTEATSGILYAGNAFLNARTASGPINRDSIQPRYSRMGTVPPVNPADWGSWIRWDKPPNQNEIIGDWEGWQFTSDGQARAYGYPADAASSRLDLNIVRLDAWTKWVKTPEPPTLPPPPGIHDPAVTVVPFTGPMTRVDQVRIFDTRFGSGANTLFAVPIPPTFWLDYKPTAVWVQLTAVPTGGQAGYLNDGHGTTFVSYWDKPATNTVLLPVSADGYIAVGASVSCHLLVDLVAYYN